jgi:hypothetical protein
MLASVGLDSTVFIWDGFTFGKVSDTVFPIDGA